MPPTATASKRLSYGPVSVSSGCYGVVAQADGSYVAGLSETSDDFPFPTSSRWYRSTDQGLTWTLVGTTQGIYGNDEYFPSNVHANIILAPIATPFDNSVSLVRSVNNGATWNTVLGAIAPVPGSGRFPALYGVQSFDRTKAICWGELDGDANNPPYTYGLSTDAGANWTPHTSWDAGDFNDYCNTMGIAENGTIYAQYTKFGGVNRTSNFARSDNGGSSWTVLSAPPGGTGTPPNAGRAIACLTPSKIVMCGNGGTAPLSSTPFVWWSDDSGATLHQLSSSDIASWPTGSFSTWCQEVKRLTRDAVWLSLDQQNGSAGSPWRISLDEGHTYEVVVDPSGASWATYQQPLGKVCVTRDGHILSTLWSSADYNTADLEIWRTTFTC
jgi:hypothetical protein